MTLLPRYCKAVQHMALSKKLQMPIQQIPQPILVTPRVPPHFLVMSKDHDCGQHGNAVFRRHLLIGVTIIHIHDTKQSSAIATTRRTPQRQGLVDGLKFLTGYAPVGFEFAHHRGVRGPQCLPLRP